MLQQAQQVGVEILAAADLIVLAWFAVGSETKERLKRRCRSLAAIVTKDEFVKVDLELGFAHTMVGSDQPLLEVADGPVGKRDNGLRAFSQLRAEGLGPNDMLVADLRQARKALETVGVDGGTGFNVLGQEGDYRRSLKVGNHRHADSTGGSPVFFHSHQDQRRPAVFELSASSESSLLTANPRIVNLYLAAKRSARRIHHRPTKFVKHHPRRLVAGEAELPLQKQRRHSALVVVIKYAAQNQ